jgi:hypothetical protein
VRGQRGCLLRSLGPVALVLSLSCSAGSATAAPLGSSESSLNSSPLVSEPDPAPIEDSAGGATNGAPASEAVADPGPEESRAADPDPAPEPDLDTASEPASLEVEEVAPIPIEPPSEPLPEPDSLEASEPASLEVEEVAPIPIEPPSEPLPEPDSLEAPEPASLEVEEVAPIPIEPLPEPLLALLPELDSLEPNQLALGSQPTSWLQGNGTIGTVDAAVSWDGRESFGTTSPATVTEARGSTRPAADRALHPTPALRLGSLSPPGRGGNVTSVAKTEANLRTPGPAVRGGREHATAAPGAETGSTFRTPVHGTGTVPALIAGFIQAQQASAGVSSALPRPSPHQPRAPPGYASSASLAPAGASSTCQPCSTDRSLRLGRSSLDGWLKRLTVVFTQSLFLSPIERPG